jgi:cell division septum initiation protein DivIVA
LRKKNGDLEERNEGLREKIDEITDKQVHCVGVQTIDAVKVMD